MILLIRCVTYSDQVFLQFFLPILLFMLAFRLGAAPPLSVMGGCVCGYCGLCGWLRHGCILQSDLMTTILFIYPHQLTPPQLTVSMPWLNWRGFLPQLNIVTPSAAPPRAMGGEEARSGASRDHHHLSIPGFLGAATHRVGLGAPMFRLFGDNYLHSLCSFGFLMTMFLPLTLTVSDCSRPPST